MRASLTSDATSSAAVPPSVDRFRAAFDQTHVGVVHTDLQGRVVIANQAFCRMVGRSHDELVGRDSSAYTHPDDRLKNAVEVHRAAMLENPGRQASGLELDKRYLRPDGSIVYAHVSLSPLRDEATGQTIGLVAIVEDVTERFRIEQIARATTRRFRFLTELAHATQDLLDPIQVMAESTRLLGTELHATRCAYADMHEDGEMFTIPDDYCVPGVFSTRGTYHLKDFGRQAWEDLSNGRTLVLRDIDRELHDDPVGVATFSAIAIKAIICCPFIRAGRLRALMAVHQIVPRDFTAEEIELIEATVERCWSYVERAKVARELAASEKRFRALADAMPQIVFAADAQGQVDYYNQRWFEYTGIDPAAAQHWATVLLPEEVEPVRERWNACVRTGAPYEIEARLRRHDGQLRWHLGRALPVRDESGRIVRWFGTNTDIHDRKLAEQIYARGEARLGDMIRTALDAIVCIDHRGIVTEWNPAAEETFGFSRDQVLGQELAELIIPPSQRQRHRDGLARHLTTGEGKVLGRRLELTAVRRDGTEFPVELTITPVTLSDPPEFTGYIRDISDRRRAEAQREQLLASEQAARTEAERANRTKDEFLATLSHELRTPLSAMLGWSQLLRNGGKNRAEMLEEGLATIERNARVQAQIIEDLLDMSRIISGKISLELQPIELADVVRAAVETVAPTATARGTRVNVELDPSAQAGTPVLGDPNRLQQVFWNLLSNAIKFTPAGGSAGSVGGPITVRIGRDASDAWSVAVTDQGEGIAPEFLPFVFDRFRQADATTTRRHGGLGLGLALVRQLTELHGGTARAFSAGRGEGATFTVMLPIAPSGAAASPATRSANGDEPVGVPDSNAPANGDETAFREILRGRLAYVVDDERDARLLLVRILERVGMHVRVAGTATELLRLLEESGDRPDVLVSDIGMPDVDGYTLIREVRARSAAGASQPPAIALSAYTRTDDRERALQAGFDAHVAKPVNARELLGKLTELVQKTGREG